MNDLTDATVFRAIAQAEGSVAGAAEALGVPRGLLIDFIARRPGIQAYLADVREGLADDAEAILGDAVDGQSSWAVRYVLTTLGKERGYGPSPEASRNGPSRPAPAIAEAPAEAPEPFDLRGKPAEADVGAVLVGARGHIARAARKLLVTRTDLKKYILCRPALQAILVDAREALVDRAEVALRHAMKVQKPWAVCFALNTLGGNRGYSKRSTPAPDLDPSRATQPAEPPVAPNPATNMPRVPNATGAPASVPQSAAAGPNSPGQPCDPVRDAAANHFNQLSNAALGAHRPQLGPTAGGNKLESLLRPNDQKGTVQGSDKPG